jgi:hypothetical protein
VACDLRTVGFQEPAVDTIRFGEPGKSISRIDTADDEGAPNVIAFGVHNSPRLQEQPKELESGLGSRQLTSFLLTTQISAKVCLQELKKNVDVLRSSGSVLRRMSRRLVVAILSEFLTMMVKYTIGGVDARCLAIHVEERIVLDDNLERVDDVFGMNQHDRLSRMKTSSDWIFLFGGIPIVAVVDAFKGRCDGAVFLLVGRISTIARRWIGVACVDLCEDLDHWSLRVLSVHIIFLARFSSDFGDVGESLVTLSGYEKSAMISFRGL